MSDAYRQILELFDLPGVAPAEDDDEPRAVGRTGSESTEFGKQALSAGDYQAAIEHFRRAVEQSGNGDANAIATLGAAYEAADREPEALRQYLRARKAQQSGDLERGLAAISLRHGKASEAIEHLKEAVRLEPGSSFAQYKLAEGLRKAGYPTAALSAVQEAIVLAPDQPFYYYWMADLLAESQRFEEASKSIQAAIELSPGDDVLYELASVALWGSGRHEDAIRAIRLALDIATEKSRYRVLLAEFLRSAGHEDEADLEIEKAGQLEPFDREELARTLRLLRVRR